MPYPAGHRLETKKKIIASARRLFNRHGFENVSIAEIMAGAELTHGGFYTYFKGKSDLYAEVLNCFFTDPEWKDCWEGVHVDLSSSDVGAQVVAAYLSRQHFEDVENSCPMVALPTDVARSGVVARRAFETVFRAMVDVLQRSVADKKRASRVECPSDRGAQHRRYGRRAHARRPRPCRRIAQRLSGGRVAVGRDGINVPRRRKSDSSRCAIRAKPQ